MKSPCAKFECFACGYADYRMSARVVGDLLEGECPKCKGDMAVTSRKAPLLLDEIGTCIEKRFEVSDFIGTDEHVEFEVSARDVKASFRKLLGELGRKGYLAAIREQKELLKLFVARRPKLKPERVWANILLFIATVGTTFFVGYLYSGSVLVAPMFSCAMLLILGIHEMGHKLAARKHGVEASYPYFIPVPIGLGTFGALIKIRGPIPTKEALVEMGTSGPLLGFLIALPFVMVGLKAEPYLEFQLPFVPLSFYLLQLLLTGSFFVPSALHPLAFAGSIGMVVTWFNVLPVGFLDGGHAARGFLSREKHYYLGRTFALILMIAGLYPPLFFFFLWGVLIFLFFATRPHPGALDDVSKISRRGRWLVFLTFTLLILCLPIPVIS